MKTFKVRVVKIKDEQCWYADKIGQVFNVRDIGSGEDYRCKRNYIEGEPACDCYIAKLDCVIVEDFKVGDRVRVKDEYVGREFRDYDDGGCGTIIDAEPGMDWQVHLDSMKVGNWWSYYANELTLLEDTMEYTKNGVTYRQLRNITVKSLILAGARDNDIDFFARVYGYLPTIPISVALDFSSRWPEKLQWLVDQGFTEKVEDEQAIHELIYYDPETNCFFRTELFGKFGHDCEFYNEAHTTIGTQEQSGRKLWRSIPIKSIEDLKKYAELYEDYGFFKVKNMK